MSDNTPFSGFGQGNKIMPPRPVAPAVPPVPAVPNVPTTSQIPEQFPFRMHHAHAYLADADQAAMIRKRDSAGDRMAQLAQIANDPDPNRADIVASIGKLTRTGEVSPEEAVKILQALPDDASGIRQWARTLFNSVMQMGIHAHAAYPREVFPGEGEPATNTQPEDTSSG